MDDGEAVVVGKGDEQLGLLGNDQAGVSHVIAGAVGQLDAEWLKRVARQQFADQSQAHARQYSNESKPNFRPAGKSFP